MSGDNNGDKALNRWHALVAVAVLLGSVVLGYATTKAQSEENTRRIGLIEEQTVRKEQLEDIRRRLDSIERKIDHMEDERVRLH